MRRMTAVRFFRQSFWEIIVLKCCGWCVDLGCRSSCSSSCSRSIGVFVRVPKWLGLYRPRQRTRQISTRHCNTQFGILLSQHAMAISVSIFQRALAQLKLSVSTTQYPLLRRKFFTATQKVHIRIGQVGWSVFV